jgi:hypothetical protein
MTYEKCPANYEWQYVLGHKGEFNPGPAALRGLEIHKSIEDYYLGTGDLHPEIPDKVIPWITEYKDKPGWVARPEMEFAYNKDWELCDFEAEEAYVRGFMDNVFISEGCWVVHEYKTGQIYDDHAHQKALYALCILTQFPNLQEVEVVGIYIDKKKKERTLYSRRQMTSLRLDWERRINRLSLPMYPARPGNHCRWCPKGEAGECPLV